MSPAADQCHSGVHGPSGVHAVGGSARPHRRSTQHQECRNSGASGCGGAPTTRPATRQLHRGTTYLHRETTGCNGERLPVIMTKTRGVAGHKRDTRKRKQDTEARGKRAQRTTQEREDATVTETDTDTEELPTTQDTKRRKMDGTCIG